MHFGPGVDPVPLAKKLTLLGRGESARHFSAPPEGGAVMLVNWKTRDTTPRRLELLSGSPIYIFSNKEEATLGVRERGLLSIQQVFWNGLLKDPTKQRKYRRLERYGRPIQTLDDYISLEEKRSVVTAGAVALLLCAKFASEIEIFGIDFYSGDYINSSYRKGTRRKELEILRPGGAAIARSIENIASAHPAVKFTLRTIAPEMVKGSRNLDVRGVGV